MPNSAAALYSCHEVSPDLVVEIDSTAPALPDTLNGSVPEAWAAAQACAGGSLFNGQIFSVREFSPTIIRGAFLEYRFAVASYSSPDLAAALRVQQLSTCGVLRTSDGFVFGRRTGRAPYEAGLWQMPPAGAVDPNAIRDAVVDLRAQIAIELEEELGLGWGVIRRSTPICVVKHHRSGVHDVGVLLDADCDFAAVQAAYAANKSNEYAELRLVTEEQLEDFFRSEGDRVVPAARMYLQTLGLIEPAEGRAVRA